MTEKPTEKFLAVLDKMLATAGKITDIVKSENEYYFRYAGHTFSVAKRSPDEYGQYSVYVYPQWAENRPLDKLAHMYEDPALANPLPTLVPYHEAQIPEQSRSKLADLYALVATRYLRVDDVFDDILSAP
jgi:hypothetical protein